MMTDEVLDTFYNILYFYMGLQFPIVLYSNAICLCSRTTDNSEAVESDVAI